MPAPIDNKLREEIIADYAVSNSVNAVRQKHGVSWATVRKIVGESETQINALREEKQKKYINDAWEVVNVYLAKLMDPKTIKEAKARDCATVIIGMLERIQRQQDLNQQFDVMYHNVERYIVEQINEEMKGTLVRRALDEYFSGEWEKEQAKRKEVIKEKMKKKTLVLTDISDYERRVKRKRDNIEYMYDQLKTEIVNEIFGEENDEE